MEWLSKVLRTLFGSKRTTPGLEDAVPLPASASKLQETQIGLWSQRANEAEVARILGTIAAPPNLRSHPIPGDLSGRFDKWFDGGAVRIDTGVCTYQFADGTKVWVGAPLPWLSVTISFPDGRQVRIEQQRD